MLKPILAALVVGALAGCISIEVNDVPDNRPAGGAQTCDAGAYHYLVGQRESDIDRSRLPAAHRIVCSTCAVTMDFNPNRLTVTLDAQSKVASARCG